VRGALPGGTPNPYEPGPVLGPAEHQVEHPNTAAVNARDATPEEAETAVLTALQRDDGSRPG
jgi:hypothetical protein